MPSHLTVPSLPPADAAWLSLMHQMAAQDYISRLQSGAAAAGLHSLAGLPQYEALAGQWTGWQGTGAGHVCQVRARSCMKSLEGLRA